MNTIGRNIRLARESQQPKLTQRALAIKLGLDTRAVGRWETGGIRPSAENLAKLAEHLDRDPGWFYTDHSQTRKAA